jgi:uncharacterized protein (TIGR02677 family)
MDTEPQSPRPFEHVHAPKSALYRGVMRAFVDAKRRFLVHLRPEDVAARLAAPSEEVEGWGNLRADPDTGRVTTVQDFYRPRYLYQLTREGEAAELALEAFDRALGRRGELQSVALEDIRVRLRALLGIVAQPEPDPAVVHGLLRDLSSLLESLAANAGAFMSSLYRTIDLQDIDEEAFIAYKDRLIGYLERFVGDLVVKAADIAVTLRELDDGRVDRLLRLVAEREATDAAPGREEGDGAAERRLEEWRGRWSGLRSWFLGDRAHPSQASLLRQRARAAVPALLAAVTTLQERHSGRTDRSADFRALAAWFAGAPTEADAHRLWKVAFGLAPSRHLTVDAATLVQRDEGDVPASTAWRDAPPVPISARLRATGHYQRRGMVSRIEDRSGMRRLLAERLAAEREQTERARERMATGRPTRLSELGELDREEFHLFLALLGDALAAGPPGPGGGVRTTTADGSLDLTLTPTGDGTTAVIATPDGVLRGPDHVITIADAGSELPEAAAGGAG